MLYIAIGILGATVMPHNLYLHSAIVQTRECGDTIGGEARGDQVGAPSIRRWPSCPALFLINAAILILSAATFHGTAHEGVADIGDAHALLSPLLGTTRRLARSSPSPCSRPGRTRPSPAPSPGRS
ncbi:MAG: divalent metal cation transporter [Gemmatimonadales bacterium]